MTRVVSIQKRWMNMTNDEVRKLNFNGWPLSDEYLIEIGRVSSLWASLESLLNLCIGKLAGFNDLNDPKAFILISHSSFPQRVDMLSTFCEQYHHQYPHLSEFKQVVSQLKAAQAKRNTYAHNGMSLNPDTGMVEMAIGSARGTLKVRIEKVDIADIRRTSIEISEAQNALYKLVLGVDHDPGWRRVNVRRNPS